MSLNALVFLLPFKSHVNASVSHFLAALPVSWTDPLHAKKLRLKIINRLGQCIVIV